MIGYMYIFTQNQVNRYSYSHKLSALFIVLPVGEMVFSTSCQFLEFWIQGNDSKTKADGESYHLSYRCVTYSLRSSYLTRQDSQQYNR